MLPKRRRAGRQALGATGGPCLLPCLASFVLRVFKNFVSHHGFPNSVALRCVPAFSVQLTPPHLFLCHPALHTRSFSAHLPKLQICSSLSRWLRAEMRKPPPPLPLAPPPSSVLSTMEMPHMHFTDRRGPPREPHCKLRPPSSQQSPQGSKHRRGTDKGCFSSTSVVFSWFSVFLEKKSCFRGQGGQSLPWGPGRGVGPFPTRKGKGGRGTDLLSAFTGHSLCDFLQRHHPTPPLLFFLSLGYL